MKVKVTNDFIDKQTKVLHEKDSTFDCSEERLKEIEKYGDFVEKIVEFKKKVEK